jgi:hypothetical protein
VIKDPAVTRVVTNRTTQEDLQQVIQEGQVIRAVIVMPTKADAAATRVTLVAVTKAAIKVAGEAVTNVVAIRAVEHPAKEKVTATL